MEMELVWGTSPWIPFVQEGPIATGCPFLKSRGTPKPWMGIYSGWVPASDASMAFLKVLLPGDRHAVKAR